MAKVDLAEKLHDVRARIAAEPTPVEEPGPKFAHLTRKDTRIREDQHLALASLARDLMKRRRIKDERITENTLIRVAIDLLLAQQQHLCGVTEDELRESVTSEVRSIRPYQ